MQEPFLSEMYKHLDDLEIRLLLLHQITEFIAENDMNVHNWLFLSQIFQGKTHFFYLVITCYVGSQ